MRAGGARAAAALLLALGLTGCVDEQPALEPPASAAAPSAAVPSAGAGTAAATPAPAVELPAGALRDLVPRPEEVPPPLVPLLQASGPRDAAAVAAFSGDPAAAQVALAEHGFADAYVAQYAAPDDPRALTVVVVRFADQGGAAADLGGDLAASSGEVVPAPVVGDASQVRRLALPDGAELVTVRLRAGATTALVAWRAARPADAEVPLGLARALAARR